MMEGASSSSSSPRLMCEQGVLKSPDGSAQFAEGDNVMLSSVYGPIAAKLSEEKLDRATVKVTFYPRTGQAGVAEKSLETSILSTCEGAILLTQYPRTCIVISVQEMQRKGPPLSACVNATCLALMDAGIPLEHLFAGVTCALLKDGTIVISPKETDLQESKAVTTFVFGSTEKQVLSVNSRGVMSEEQFQECLQRCREASGSIFDFYWQTVRKKFHVET